MPDTQLKSCPFCGGEGALDGKPHGDGETAHYVRCLSCGCEGPWMKTEGNAIRLWNLRTPEKVTPPMRKIPKPRVENVQPEWLQKMVVGIAEARHFICILDGERFSIVKSPGSRWWDNSGGHYSGVDFMVVDKQHPEAYSVGRGIMRAGITLKHGGRINKTHKDFFKQLAALTDRDVMLEALKSNGY